MTKPLSTHKLFATLPTIAARQNHLVQLTKKSVLLLLMLATGLVAHATVQTGIRIQGFAQTQNNTTMCVGMVESKWGGEQIGPNQGSSYTFSNTSIAGVTLNGTLNFQESSSVTDVITGSTFTVTITKSDLWFYGATVQTKSGSNVSGCTTTVSSNKHTLTVTIPSGKTFGAIIVDYVTNEPFSSSNTTISGIEATYVYQGSAIAPVPTVTYNGTVLNAGTDYTVSYANNNGAGTATLTVTGTGEYAGTVTRTYTIRNVALSDFTSLGSNTYAIANKDDLDRLALLVDYAANDCQGITFRQTADIAYSHGSSTTENNFTQIGGYFNGDKNFCGTYDGQNHTISGIRVYKSPSTNANANKNVALFGRISTGATIQNVILTDASFTGYRIVGGIVGNSNNGGTVQNCLVLESTITSGNTYGGVIVGRDPGTLTANHYHNCTVTVGSSTSATTNVGVGGNGGISSSSDMAGARSIHTLTVQNANVTTTGESVTYQNTTYYASNTTITLGYNNSTGYQVTYSLNGTALSGNTFTMPANDNATVSATLIPITYNITYDLNGGSVATANPTSYNVTTPTFTLNNPIKTGYNFDGWTGTDLNEATQTVTITQGSIGDRNYTAHWTDVWGVTNGANGSSDQPYLITNTAGLDLLATEVNNGSDFSGTFFKLGNDITYSHTSDWDDATSTENNFAAIGRVVGNTNYSFKGTFDGDGHTVSGIRITQKTSESQGLFGYVGEGGTVENLTLSNARIFSNKTGVGGIAGDSSGTITNCHVTADVNILGNNNYHGGIAGNSNGDITGCTSAAVLNGSGSYRGGITGQTADGTVSNCIVTGVSYSCDDEYCLGAIVGNHMSGTLSNNYYHACSVNGATTNIGVGTTIVGVSNDTDGAKSVHALTLADGITAIGNETVVINGTTYYAAGSTITLSYDGTPAAGMAFDDFTVTDANGNPVTVTGDTFTMPAGNVTVTVIFAPIPPSYTVHFVAVGHNEGSQTAYEGDEISLPGSVSVDVNGWTFSGWVDAELAETVQKPVFYAPGASYTVTANATLYALYTRTEGGTGEPVYELITEAPSDWSGNYVITNGETSSMYVLKGVTGSSSGTNAENSNNCSAFDSSGITLTDNVLHNVADDYVMTLEAQGSYYTLYNAAVGSYYGMSSTSYLYAYSGYNTTYCDWTPGMNDSHGVSLKNKANGSYPYLSFSINNNYFWSGSANNANILRLWKENNWDGVYYTTDPTVSAPAVPVESIVVNPDEIEMNVGATYSIIFTVLPADASITAVTFSSADETIATVDADGVVTGVGAGETTITIASVSNPEVTADVTVSVTAVGGSGTWAQMQFINQLMLIGNYEGELIDTYVDVYQEDGWTLVDYNLNSGTNSDQVIYLLYKTGLADDPDHAPITDFYIKSTSDQNDHPDLITYNNREYFRITSFEGSDSFLGSYGDLNDGTGGKYIYLYYTTDAWDHTRGITEISFDNNSDGAVCGNGGTTPQDLNEGTYGDIIYMHYKVTETYTLEINGYTSQTTGWHLIASPLNGEIEVDDVEHMQDNTFDLYCFNQAADEEWENWKADGTDHYHFTLESGKGYLYANSGNVTINFVGTPYSGNGEVTLTKNNNADLPGWNLVGNPFADTAYIDRPFYVMNAGAEIIVASAVSRNYIEPMEGIFVVANTDGETLTFSTTAPSKGRGQKPESEQIVIELSALTSQLSPSIVDRVIVRFDDGPQLPKFQLDPSHAKVYIPQDGKDYAVVNANGMGELPVHFKAKENGEYTLTVSAPLTSHLSSLHLIDNLTGAEVDLLATPSYTFNARNNDQVSRFKLVFAN